MSLMISGLNGPISNNCKGHISFGFSSLCSYFIELILKIYLISGEELFTLPTMSIVQR